MGERFLGRISSAGTSTNNLTTATPFVILPGQKLTVVASAAGRVIADSEVCIATPTGPNFGVPVSANSVFPTSCGKASANMPNAPGSTTAVLAFLPTSGAADLDVWTRSGQE